MNDLLQLAVDAHGGLARWNQLKTVRASLSITGAIWQVKGRPDVLKDVSIEAELHQERLTTHFNGQGKHAVFEPNRITIETETGQVLEIGPDGLLRRHEYTVDVMGGTSGLNYAADANKHKIQEPVLVAIDIRDISFQR